jgi:hypothetical protein
MDRGSRISGSNVSIYLDRYSLIILLELLPCNFITDPALE